MQVYRATHHCGDEPISLGIEAKFLSLVLIIYSYKRVFFRDTAKKLSNIKNLYRSY